MINITFLNIYIPTCFYLQKKKKLLIKPYSIPTFERLFKVI